jgi:hypothetical protein
MHHLGQLSMAGQLKDSDLVVHAHLEGTVLEAHVWAQLKFRTPLESYISSKIQHIGHFTVVGGKAPN